MKLNVLLGCAVVAGLVIISSCSDDSPPPDSGISFEITELEVVESDGTIESFHPDLFGGAIGKNYMVTLTMDRPLRETVILNYSLSGTATNINPADIYDVNDFSISEGLNTIVGTDKITIEEGATEATLVITVYEDYLFEVDDDDNLFETIIIQLISVASGPAKIGDDDTFTLTIKEDDIVVILDWLANDSPNEDRGDVDMDLLLQLDNEIVWGFPDEGNENYEVMPIPAGFPAGTYGLSYNYYEGTSDDLDFISIIWGSEGTLNGSQYIYPIDDPLIYEGHYALANIFAWSGINPPQVVQTMVKNGINYSNITDITEPSTGSRMKSRIQEISKSEVLRQLKTKKHYKLR